MKSQAKVRIPQIFILQEDSCIVSVSDLKDMSYISCFSSLYIIVAIHTEINDGKNASMR